VGAHYGFVAKYRGLGASKMLTSTHRIFKRGPEITSTLEEEEVHEEIGLVKTNSSLTLSWRLRNGTPS
jgi:hypothetical protein